MAYPVPGDVGVEGQIVWCAIVSNGLYSGVVEAYASIYGTPPAYTEPDPLKFQFSSTQPFNSGDGVTFDVVAGTFAPYATNLRLV